MHATWTVPADHPTFAGHFPGRPIVPGVVLLDHAILIAAGFLNHPATQLRLGNAKFLSPVGPGETLHFSFRSAANGGLAFDIRAADREVATGSLTFPEA